MPFKLKDKISQLGEIPGVKLENGKKTFNSIRNTCHLHIKSRLLLPK